MKLPLFYVGNTFRATTLYISVATNNQQRSEIQWHDHSLRAPSK